MIFKIVITILTLLYPLIVFYGLQSYSIQVVSLCVFIILSLRGLSLYWLKNKQDKKNQIAKEQSTSLNFQSGLQKSTPVVTLLVFALVLGVGFVLDSDMGLLLYPVVINAVLAITFYYSLLNPPPIIERLARLTKPNLPEHAIKYTRKVTIVWLCFFIINGLISYYTAFFCELQTWTLYNGLISYILMGTLFAIEYLVRLQVQKRHEG